MITTLKLPKEQENIFDKILSPATDEQSKPLLNLGDLTISNTKRAYHSHFAKVNRRQSPRFHRIRKKTPQSGVFSIKMADEEPG